MRVFDDQYGGFEATDFKAFEVEHPIRAKIAKFFGQVVECEYGKVILLDRQTKQALKKYIKHVAEKDWEYKPTKVFLKRQCEEFRDKKYTVLNKTYLENLFQKSGSNDAECINSARARDKSEIKKAFEWLKKHDSVRCPVAVSDFILRIIFTKSDK